MDLVWRSHRPLCLWGSDTITALGRQGPAFRARLPTSPRLRRTRRPGKRPAASPHRANGGATSGSLCLANHITHWKPRGAPIDERISARSDRPVFTNSHISCVLIGNFVLHRLNWFFCWWFEPKHPPVSSDLPRKAFFAKLGGLIMAAAVVPKLFARSGSPTPATAPASVPFQLRPETRAVARQEGVN